MARCFIIQPFDKGEFDKRYDDVFVPAVEAAGLQPYRVDRDLTAVIPIETIEKIFGMPMFAWRIYRVKTPTSGMR